MKVIPRDDRVLVKPCDEEEKSKGGILIPDAAKEKPMMAEVVAVGPGKWVSEGPKQVRQELDLKVGDKILFGKYAGTEIKVDDQALLVLRADDIIGTVE